MVQVSRVEKYCNPLVAEGEYIYTKCINFENNRSLAMHLDLFRGYHEALKIKP